MYNATLFSKQEFFAPGRCIIQQGDKGDKFYMITGGNVKVTKLEPGLSYFIQISFQ
jgi:CRP-like cAMP-binding protein